MLIAPPYGLNGPRSRREQRVVRIRRPVYSIGRTPKCQALFHKKLGFSEFFFCHFPVKPGRSRRYSTFVRLWKTRRKSCTKPGEKRLKKYGFPGFFGSETRMGRLSLHGHMTIICNYRNFTFEQTANSIRRFCQKSSEYPIYLCITIIFTLKIPESVYFLIIRQLTGIHVFDTL